mmetsp:Transcript_78191/g.173309  ORF Transcript_78191/g.173309 Transcript_78191/m.173309 type:complete len:163 (+) Transcript_78191:68-556(+)
MGRPHVASIDMELPPGAGTAPEGPRLLVWRTSDAARRAAGMRVKTDSGNSAASTSSFGMQGESEHTQLFYVPPSPRRRLIRRCASAPSPAQRGGRNLIKGGGWCPQSQPRAIGEADSLLREQQLPSSPQRGRGSPGPGMRWVADLVVKDEGLRLKWQREPMV